MGFNMGLIRVTIMRITIPCNVCTNVSQRVSMYKSSQLGVAGDVNTSSPLKWGLHFY